MINETKRQRYDSIRGQLDSERSSFISHWRTLSDYILPRRARFTISDVNKGDRRNTNIIDSTATLAARTLRSGMMGGVTSPARPWFRLSTPDPQLAEFGKVKDWLHIVEIRLASMFLKSNLYNILPIMYGDLGVFGTAAYSVEEDMINGLHCQSFPIGSYRIAKDDRGKINVFCRDFRMTVRQLLSKFGDRGPDGKIKNWKNFSATVRTAHETNQLEQWVDVCHLIHPNEDYDEGRLESKFKKFSSCYYEIGSQSTGSEDVFLSEKGYDYFPVLVPRWEVTGEDVYATDCPGMAALGDIKQLQLGEKRSMQAVDKMVNPPMVGPTSLKTTKSSIISGDMTFLDAREGMQGFRAAHEVRLSINELEAKQDQCRNRIRRCFYEDLFLLASSDDRSGTTAREISERHEEKLLALGPVLEQLNQDSNDPLVDIGFDIGMRRGMFPPPPEELQGVELKVDYISIMAQAQKIAGIGNIERFAGFVGNVMTATQDASVMDKIDLDQMIDVYADMTSVPPGIVRADEAVAEMRQSRQAAQQQAQRAAQVQQTARSAKDLSQADTGGDNALTRLIEASKAGQIVQQ